MRGKCCGKVEVVVGEINGQREVLAGKYYV